MIAWLLLNFFTGLQFLATPQCSLASSQWGVQLQDQATPSSLDRQSYHRNVHLQTTLSRTKDRQKIISSTYISLMHNTQCNNLELVCDQNISCLTFHPSKCPTSFSYRLHFRDSAICVTSFHVLPQLGGGPIVSRTPNPPNLNAMSTNIICIQFTICILY